MCKLPLSLRQVSHLSLLQEYMLCRKEEKDPRKCLREGKAVTGCAVEFFNKVKLSCADVFTSYWKCLDHSQESMDHKQYV